MTDQEKQAMNIAIAEAMGWKWHGDLKWVKSIDLNYWEKDGFYYRTPPNFTGSLDAMATPEATLDLGEWHAYVNRLSEQIIGEPCDGEFGAYRIGLILKGATAGVRAESFCCLRKIGPFAEGKG